MPASAAVHYDAARFIEQGKTAIFVSHAPDAIRVVPPRLRAEHGRSFSTARLRPAWRSTTGWFEDKP